MPLEFRKAYCLTFSGSPELSLLAVGVYPRKVYPGSADLPGFYFLTDSKVPGHESHLIVGLVTRDEGDGVVEVTESQRVAEGGAHRVWRFTPMTKDLWVRLPRSRDEQAEVDALAKVFQTDEAVQGYLLDEYLDEQRYPAPPES